MRQSIRFLSVLLFTFNSLEACGGGASDGSVADDATTSSDGANPARDAAGRAADGSNLVDAGAHAGGDDATASSDGSSLGTDATRQGADGASPSSDAACALEALPSPTCNAIAPTGPVVTTSSSSDMPGTPQAGALLDGTYVLVSSTSYGAASTSMVDQTTWVICGRSWMVADTSFGSDGGGLVTIRANFTASIQDASAVLTQTCASLTGDYSMTRAFTVSGNQLTFQRTVNTVTLVTAFNRQ